MRFLAAFVLLAACAPAAEHDFTAARSEDDDEPAVPIWRGEAREGRDVVERAPDPILDRDGDGLDDAFEDFLAAAYLPFLANHPDDGCPLSGIVFRARPHPDDETLVNIIYSWLYERDCGLNGHVGDNEAFGTTVDPARPPPEGLLAVVAVSHQNTPCQRTTSCGVCGGLGACERSADGRVVVFSSRGKHALNVDRRRGCGFGTCFDTCEMSEASAQPPLVNAGEPGAPLVRDLTLQGFIDAERGWTAARLFHYDPWSGDEFGTAGVVAGDLVDDAFVPPACR